EWFLRAGPESAVTVYCDRSFLLEKFASDLDKLPAAVRGYALGSRPELIFQALPLDPIMLRIMGELRDTRLCGAFRRVFIESKVTELVTLFLSGCQEQALRPVSSVRLKPRDIDRLHEARGLMLGRLTDPPTIDALA